MTSELTFKKVKVSDKGQISIPVDVQRQVGIRNGDELLLITKGKKIFLEKSDKIAEMLEDELDDMEDVAEASLGQIWLKKEENIWNQYLKSRKK